MEEIKLIKQDPPFTNFALVFRIAGEFSEDLCFESEEECDRVLKEAIEGKGILVRYNSEGEFISHRIYPSWITKMKIIEDYRVKIVSNVLAEAGNIGHKFKKEELG